MHTQNRMEGAMTDPENKIRWVEKNLIVKFMYINYLIYNTPSVPLEMKRFPFCSVPFKMKRF